MESEGLTYTYLKIIDTGICPLECEDSLPIFLYNRKENVLQPVEYQKISDRFLTS